MICAICDDCGAPCTPGAIICIECKKKWLIDEGGDFMKFMRLWMADYQKKENSK